MSFSLDADRIAMEGYFSVLPVPKGNPEVPTVAVPLTTTGSWFQKRCILKQTR